MGFGGSMVRDTVVDIMGDVKFALIRRDPATLFVELRPWIEKTLKNATSIKSMCMTGENGNITIAIIFTEAPPVPVDPRID